MRQFLAMDRLTSANTTVSLHVLRLQNQAPSNPNAFLNLARLLAPTSTVVMFPGELGSVPPKSFARTLTSNTSATLAVYSTRGRTAFPFSPYSPLLIGRDDPVWCNERFFPYISRSADWQECLWQVWLANFGNIDVRQTTDWVADAAPSTATNVRSPQVRIRHFHKR